MDDISKSPTLLDRICSLAPEIVSRADEIERSRGVPAEISDKLRDYGAYRMLVPRRYGGMELNFVELSEVLEELACADGSTAWSVMVTASHNLLLGLFPDDFVNQLFGATQSAQIRGGLSPMSTALPVEGGYIVKGRTPLASGSFEHQWVIVLAILVDDEGRPRIGADGEPESRIVLVPQEKSDVLPTWDAMGLRGSGSDDIVLHEQFVPHLHTTTLAAPSNFDTIPARFGVFVSIPPDHASVALGIARGALEDLAKLARSKRPVHSAGKKLSEDAMFAHRLGGLAIRWDAARAYLRYTVAKNWEMGELDSPMTPEQAMRTAGMSAYVQNECIDIVNEVFTLAGVSSCYNSSSIQRRYRDIRCLGQHLGARLGSYQLLGNILVA